jgi:hypothetical protein
MWTGRHCATGESQRKPTETIGPPPEANTMRIVEKIMDKSTPFWTYVASLSTAIGGWLSLNNIAILIGILTTIVLGVVQFRHWIAAIKLNNERRLMEREFHEARMRQVKGDECAER